MKTPLLRYGTATRNWPFDKSFRYDHATMTMDNKIQGAHASSTCRVERPEGAAGACSEWLGLSTDDLPLGTGDPFGRGFHMRRKRTRARIEASAARMSAA